MASIKKSPEKYCQNRHYYKRLFSSNPSWSTLYPNADEKARWLKIEKLLVRLAKNKDTNLEKPLRILDIGCGRGWLTNLASTYGDSEGVDPVPESIQTARRMYPNLKFFIGTAKEVYESNSIKPYNIVIASEVLEHITDKHGFIKDMKKCLLNHGSIVITTPRKELFNKWIRLEYERQPVEQWLTEKEVFEIFRSQNLGPIYHDRIYFDLPKMSALHRLCASRKLKYWFRRTGLKNIHTKLQYTAAIYQIWCFKFRNKNDQPEAYQ